MIRLLALVLLVVAVVGFLKLASDPLGQRLTDWDRQHYLQATTRWLTTGSPYVAAEVAAPFEHSAETFLHPPIALPLFALYLALPAVLWYAVPIGVIVSHIVSARPGPVTTFVVAMLAAWPMTGKSLLTGNTDMWVGAITAAAVRWGWPSVLVAVKPSFLPFLFIGAGRRAWWVAGAAVMAVGLAFGTLWLEWLSVVRNAPEDPLYSIRYISIPLIPLIAWVGRDRARGSSGADS